MKRLWILLIFAVTISGFAQTSVCEKELAAINAKRQYFAEMEWNDAFDKYDSLDAYNKQFLTQLLACTKTKDNLKYPFEQLKAVRIWISTSPDGLFRIYSWDDETGGTMRYAENVFQFSDGQHVNSQKLGFDVFDENDRDAGLFYDVLDEVVSGGKKYYVVKGVFIGSSAVSSHKIKIFSIDNGKLNDKAVLIKTKSGIRNELQYSVDFSASVNRNSDIPRETAWIEYDKATKTISIPLIAEDDKITTKKIRYRFNGTYFEKL